MAWMSALTAAGGYAMSAIDKLRASKGAQAAPMAGFSALARTAGRRAGFGPPQGPRRRGGGLSKRDVRGFYKTVALLKKVGMKPKGLGGRGHRGRR